MTRSETTAASGFDPAAVPVYPVMRLETGPGQVTVNGQPVTTRPGQSAMEAAIGLVAARAATANARGVRVLVVDEGGHEFWHVIDADGGVHDLTEEQQRPVSASRRRQQRFGAVLLAGGLVLVIALVGAVVLVARGSSDGHAATQPTHTVTVKPSPTATQLPALTVPGWSSVALWGSPAVASVDSQAPAVTLDTAGGVFAVLGSDSSSSVAVSRLSASTGKPVWSVEIPGEELFAGPVLATVGGRRVVLAATDSKVSAVDVSTRAVTSWAIPDGADTSAVRLTAAGPVITKSSTTATIVDAKGRPVDRSVPAGATAWWPLEDGKALTVDASGRVWRSASARVAGKPGKLRAPKKRVGAGTVAATGRVLVQQWATGDSGSGEVVLVGYSMPDLKPVWTSKPVAAVDSSQTQLFGDWLWTDSQLVNTRDGHVVHLPNGVTVVAVDHDTIWGAGEEGSLSTYDTAGHRQQSAATSADTGSDATGARQATPVGEVGGRLLVAAAADSGNGQRLFLLPPDGSAASSSSSSRSSSAASSSSKSPASSKRASSSKKPRKSVAPDSKPSKARRSVTSPAKHAASKAAAKAGSS